MSAALAVDSRNVRVQTLRDSEPVVQRMHLRCGRKPAWSVVQSHPQAERWADANLRRQGYETYLPLCLVLRRDPVLRTLTRQVEAPLFTSYLFVRLDIADPWTPIRYAPGVCRLLMTDEKPYILPDGLLARLQATEASRRYPSPPGALWAAGDAFKAVLGPCQGHEGVVLAVHRQTATVALLLFGHLREVQMPLDALGPRD